MSKESENFRYLRAIHEAAAIRYKLLFDTLSTSDTYVKIHLLKGDGSVILSYEDFKSMNKEIDEALEPVADKWIKKIRADTPKAVGNI